MRKIIAAMNMTLDGDCDHTSMYADDELHEHYNDLLRNGDTLIYGRTTYQLMESYWPTVVKSPTGNKAEDDFAVLIQNINKIVFSHTLKNVEWENSRLAKEGFKEEVLALKRQTGGNILLGSPSVIVAALNLHLLDEFQICVQPTISGGGLPLFKNITERINLTLERTKTFGNGSIVFYYSLGGRN
jgi:dihydrofolate reductase